MAEPTKTRAELRRAIGQALNMPFFDKFETGSVIAGATPSTSVIYDTSLGEPDGYWENMWLIMTSGSASPQVRKIINHDRSANALQLDYPLTASPAIGDGYEIYSISPHSIHRKINAAIEEGFPAFFEMIEAEEFCLVEDKLEYDLSTELTTAPWRVYGIWLERSRTRRLISPDDITATGNPGSITFSTDIDLTDVDSDWFVSVYDGDSDEVGQVIQVSSVSGQSVTLVSDWTTIPSASTAYVCLWNGGEDDTDWYRVMAARFYPQEFPSTLYLTREYDGFEGMRIRLLYSAKPAALSAEASTTVLPELYIRHKAINLLATDLMSDTRVDRSKWERIASVNWELAEQAKRVHHRRPPNETIWQEYDPTPVSNQGFDSENGNPLGWR